MRQPWWPRIDTNSGSEESGSDRVVSSLAATNAGQMQLADSEAGLTHKELTFEHTWNYLVCTVLIEGMLMPGGGQHTAAGSAQMCLLPVPLMSTCPAQQVRCQCRTSDINALMLTGAHRTSTPALCLLPSTCVY